LAKKDSCKDWRMQFSIYNRMLSYATGLKTNGVSYIKPFTKRRYFSFDFVYFIVKKNSMDPCLRRNDENKQHGSPTTRG